MNADLLRKAAAILRDRAEAATVSPWEASPVDGLVWANRLGDPVSGSTLAEDAVYIATVHPGVGLALADWLEREADFAAYGIESPTSGVVWESPHALAVARLIVGEQA